MRVSHRSKWMTLALLAGIGVCREATAQQRYRMIEEPQAAKIRVSSASAGLYTEGNIEETSFENSGTSVTHRRLFAGPELNLTLNGSIYHPNLLSYYLLSDGALGWAEDTISSPGRTQRRTEFQALGRFMANAHLFGDKPLTGNIFGSYNQSYRDYDFFNRARVEGWRTGGELIYRADSLYLQAIYTRRDETVSGGSIDSHVAEDVFSLTGRHSRDSGGTTANYTFNRYNRSDFDRPATGSNHAFSLADEERFGDHDQFRLQSNLGYNHRIDDTNPSNDSSDQLNAGVALSADHWDNLSSYYNFDYSHYQDNNFDSDSYQGRAQLQHRLYDSLTSTLVGYGSTSDISSDTSSSSEVRLGGGLIENYRKQLGPDHRLQINNTFMAEHVDRDEQGDFLSLLRIEGERHSFTEGSGGTALSFALNRPNAVDVSIQISDLTRTRVFIRNIDYAVFQSGALTMIQRITGSSMPNTVLVDYRAEATPGGSYQAFTETCEVRFSFFNNFWNVYGRVGLSFNNAPEQLLVQNLATYTFGSDINWRWLRAGAEYSIFDSDFSKYKTLMFFQSLAFKPDDNSTLSFTFTESWTDYEDANRQEQNYRFISRYHYAFSGNLGLDLEGGLEFRRGPGVDQTLATVRPGLQYRIGKTTIKAGYDYQYSLFLNNEQRNRHLFFARIKRAF